MASVSSNYLGEIFSSKEQIDNFFKCAGDLFLFIDKKGTILYSNDSVKELLGYYPKQIINKHIQFLFPEEYITEQNQIFQEVLSQKITMSINKNMVFKAKYKNSKKKVSVSINSVNTEDGKIICCIVHDFTNVNLKIEKLKTEKKEVEELAQTKTELLAQMSHEIRSPVNIIMNFTGLVREVLSTEVQDSLKEEFAIIKNAGKRIIRTIDLVLSMSEIQSGQLDLHRTKFDLYQEIVVRVYNEFRLMANERNLDFFLHCSIQNTIIYADEYTVFQTLMNIVDNAFKYTDKGRIEITLDQQKNGQLFILVSDTGIGMSEEFKKDIFKPFHQEDTGLTGKIKGNGLGLSLVKKYCDLNNMQIKITSKKGKGSKVKLIFPSQPF